MNDAFEMCLIEVSLNIMQLSISFFVGKVVDVEQYS